LSTVSIEAMVFSCAIDANKACT